MMYLLDTHAFIWTVLETDKLSKNVRSIITDINNEIYVSAVSFWEISLKTSIKKFSFENISIKNFPKYAREMDFSIMNIQENETITFHELSAKEKHKDPFDRMLIWQAITKNMIMVSRDESFNQYEKDGLKLVW